MATINDLKEVVKETLENRGVMGQLKARIRAEVFNALDDHAESRPALSNENMMINELIREYLEFNKYKYSSSTLLAESGQPQTPLDRQFLSNELNIMEDRDTAAVPLLYSIVSHFMNQSRSNAQRTPRSAGRSRHVEQTRRSDGEDLNRNGFSHQKGFIVEGGRH